MALVRSATRLVAGVLLLAAPAAAQPAPAPGAGDSRDGAAPADPPAAPAAPPTAAPSASAPRAPGRLPPGALPPSATGDLTGAAGFGPMPPPGGAASEGAGAAPAASDSAAPSGTAAPTPPARPPGPKSDGEIVFAEDWWGHARPIFEVHGYFRVRSEMFHQFTFNRIEAPADSLWPVPTDSYYETASGDVYGPVLCTAGETGDTESDSIDRTGYQCGNSVQVGANMRFRLQPELHISDNLRIITQLDLLDNLVLGSTPEGYAFEPSGTGGYRTVARGAFTPIGALDATQVAPRSGVNSLQDSVEVKRAWAEYTTPIGELRFGRMPSHWGLGMVHNAGDGYDDDYQTTVDRISFVSGIRRLDLYAGLSWDFPNVGLTSQNLTFPGIQPYDVAQQDDVRQWTFVLVRRRNPQLAAMDLGNGKPVINGGLHLMYRTQRLARDDAATSADGGQVPGAWPVDAAQYTDDGQTGYVRRGASIWVPDLWVQFLFKKFRFEMEFAAVTGTIENTLNSGSNYDEFDGWRIQQFGLAAEFEQALLKDQLRLKFQTGWASGDADAATGTTSAGGLVPGFSDALLEQSGNDTISTFRFHPTYRVDLILWRNVMTRVSGAYYFKPSAEYDFIQRPDGQRLGGGAGFIWSRASSIVQTPGHKPDLGLEIDARVYYQSKDGARNDKKGVLAGFYAMAEYGVLFPFGGLGYQPEEEAYIESQLGEKAADVNPAQIFRVYLGVIY